MVLSPSTVGAGGMRSDLIFGVIIGCVAGFLLWHAYQLPDMALFSGVGVEMLWPQTVLWGLIFLSLILFGRSLRNVTRAAAEPNLHGDIRQFSGPLVITIVGTAFFALLDILGFMVAVPLFTTTLLVALRRRRWLEVCGVTVTLTAVLWLVFINLLNIPLPLGKGVFQHIGVFFQ